MTILLALALLLAGTAPAAADPVSGTIAAFLATTGAAPASRSARARRSFIPGRP